METVNQGNNAANQEPENRAANQAQDNGVKTFTQEEVDRIVGDRLKRDREKYADYEALKEKAAKFDELEEANKTELEKANDRLSTLQQELDTMKAREQVRGIREKVAEEMNIPVNLLTSDTEDGCKAQAEAIKAYAQPTYPAVNDGGEPQNSKGQATRDQFAAWLQAQK